MPPIDDHAVRRRDQWLARTRRVSLWVAAGAAAASLGLGTAFAHALPGHRGPAAGAQPGAAAGHPPQGTQPRSTQPPGTGATGSPAAPSPAATHLTQPAQPPATTAAPPQATSGGS